MKKPDLLSMKKYLEGEEIAEVMHKYVGGTVHAMAGATIPSLKVLMLVETDRPGATVFRRKPDGSFFPTSYMRVRMQCCLC